MNCSLSSGDLSTRSSNSLAQGDRSRLRLIGILRHEIPAGYCVIRNPVGQKPLFTVSGGPEVVMTLCSPARWAEICPGSGIDISHEQMRNFYLFNTLLDVEAAGP